jgi:hypothetical protein
VRLVQVLLVGQGDDPPVLVHAFHLQRERVDPGGRFSAALRLIGLR